MKKFGETRGEIKLGVGFEYESRVPNCAECFADVERDEGCRFVLGPDVEDVLNDS